MKWEGKYNAKVHGDWTLSERESFSYSVTSV